MTESHSPFRLRAAAFQGWGGSTSQLRLSHSGCAFFACALLKEIHLSRLREGSSPGEGEGVAGTFQPTHLFVSERAPAGLGVFLAKLRDISDSIVVGWVSMKPSPSLSLDPSRKRRGVVKTRLAFGS